jgi:hypothetical protein
MDELKPRKTYYDPYHKTAEFQEANNEKRVIQNISQKEFETMSNDYMIGKDLPAENKNEGRSLVASKISIREDMTRLAESGKTSVRSDLGDKYKVLSGSRTTIKADIKDVDTEVTVTNFDNIRKQVKKDEDENDT